MAQAAKIHFSRITRRVLRDGFSVMTTTGTLCNRMSNAGDDINCTTDPSAVTCKFCLRIGKDNRAFAKSEAA
jgi:hypothetical protein